MTNKTKQQLLQEIESALGTIDFGSVEIYVSDKKVTQITVRNIQKTSIDINDVSASVEESIKSSGQPKDKIFTIQANFRRSS